MEPPVDVPSKRAVCTRCRRPQCACYCAALPPTPLRTQRTRVVVLQHANEQRQRHAISSVPVLAQVLTAPTSVQVLPLSLDNPSGEGDTTNVLCQTLHEQLDHEVLAEGVEAVLVLFPHADATTLTTDLCGGERHLQPHRGSADDTETDKTVVLVVVDGTWTEAKKIIHHSRRYWATIARDCRSRNKVFEYVCLDSTAVGRDHDVSASHPTASIYGELRKEPMDGCVSTLEAVAMALRVLEPASGSVCDAMCSAFQEMVAIQTAFQRRGKASQQAKHGGTPKPTRKANRAIDELAASIGCQETSGRGVAKPYVFYTTHTDFRKRQRLVMEGDVLVCTRDDAIARCRALNRDRSRGHRVSILPEEAFQRQQLQYETHHI